MGGGHALAGVGHLVRRDNHNAFLLALTALALGIERADALDLIAKEINAHRPFGVGGPDIQQVAAPRKRAGKLHQLRSSVAKGVEASRRLIERERIPDFHGEATGFEHAGRWGKLEQRRRGGDQNLRRDSLRQIPQQPHALARAAHIALGVGIIEQ